jgi:gas vesicle protein
MTDTSSQDPDAIRAEIERTRSSLGSDVDALADKVTPSKIVDREKAKAKDAISSVKDRVFGVASDVKGSVSDAAHGAKDSVAGHASSAGSSVGDLPHKAVSTAQGSPLAVGLIAFGVGLLVSSLIPASEKEKELAADVKDAAQPLVEGAQSLGKEVAANLKEPAMDAVNAVKDDAADAAQTVKGEATDAAQTVKDEAQSATSDVKDEAQNARHAVQGDATS